MNKNLDPYRAAQARQRKAANLTRRAALRQQEKDSLGDPVQSRSTPFIESLQPQAPLETIETDYINHFIRKDEIQHTLDRSKWLSEPIKVDPLQSKERFDKVRQRLDSQGVHDPAEIMRRIDVEHDENVGKHQTLHENAADAMSRITALSLGSGGDRRRLNVQRCIEEFGRHNTDQYLPPKPASSQAPPIDISDVPIRSGPDTGSSEVQIAVLTAKINILAANLKNKDKHNKRNLRLLVHKRQKLLSYLRRKERGGSRWQNIVEKLGINDAMWKGEISLA